ncbi:FAD-dependent oxidoreductase [Nocardioides sp. TF02-7]|uniref:FAD-dependent oxidoreductase n=1 Tax=Nocardioides sp. TF02-7 TaxID=2917724 RepID=UPI001F06963E|nr:FAD-dependent oxidoreductase [Nocardioides sp. TF02-7]UMG94101.1 FAD-dependent oxidoreductase [Nocardioides sp. TF02-7]
MTRRTTAIVVGAGVAGATTALALRRDGLDVTLLDAWEPGHAAAASAGEHRILRSSHGTDELYTRLSREGRLGWLELGEQTGQELFVQCGAVMLAREGNTSWEDASRATLSRLGIPHFVAPAHELPVRLPVMDARGLAYGLWEPEAGFVYAKRATLAAIEQLRREGGTVRRGRVTTDRDEHPTLDGKRLTADVVVLAAGAWMSDLFPRTLRRMLDVVRQNVIMVAPPAGTTGYDHTDLPCWIDHGNHAYGIPAAGGHGFKAVLVWRQLSIDLERDDRIVDATSIARTRRYLSSRFPELADRPITQMAVGQIANTADTHFVIDRHPAHPHLTLVAGDSGHLFKHGPAIGRYVADVALERHATDERFRIKDRGSVSLADRPQ